MPLFNLKSKYPFFFFKKLNHFLYSVREELIHQPLHFQRLGPELRYIKKEKYNRSQILIFCKNFHN